MTKLTPQEDRRIKELAVDYFEGNPLGLPPRPASADVIEGMRWQPIESAPKDGTRILLADARTVVTGDSKTEEGRGDPWECPSCECMGYAHIDERKADGSYGPGPEIRCLNCKRVWPNASPPAPVEAGRGARGLLQTALDLFELTDACQTPGTDAYTWRYHASDYLNGNDNLTGEAGRGEREAHKAADEAMHRIWSEWFTFYQNHVRTLNVAISSADQHAFYEIAQPILRRLAALSQGNGEAVGWRYRYEWFGKLKDWIYAPSKDIPDAIASEYGIAVEIEPLYAAPSSPPEGVREALEQLDEWIADAKKENDSATDSKTGYGWACNLRGLQSARELIANRITPSRGLVDAAEWPSLRYVPEDTIERVARQLFIIISADSPRAFHPAFEHDADLWFAAARQALGAYYAAKHEARTLSAKGTANADEKGGAR